MKCLLSEDEPTWFKAMLRSVVPRSNVCIMLIHDDEVRPESVSCSMW